MMNVFENLKIIVLSLILMAAHAHAQKRTSGFLNLFCRYYPYRLPLLGTVTQFYHMEASLRSDIHKINFIQIYLFTTSQKHGGKDKIRQSD